MKVKSFLLKILIAMIVIFLARLDDDIGFWCSIIISVIVLFLVDLHANVKHDKLFFE